MTQIFFVEMSSSTSCLRTDIAVGSCLWVFVSFIQRLKTKNWRFLYISVAWWASILHGSIAQSLDRSTLITRRQIRTSYRHSILSLLSWVLDEIGSVSTLVEAVAELCSLLRAALRDIGAESLIDGKFPGQLLSEVGYYRHSFRWSWIRWIFWSDYSSYGPMFRELDVRRWYTSMSFSFEEDSLSYWSCVLPHAARNSVPSQSREVECIMAFLWWCHSLQTVDICCVALSVRSWIFLDVSVILNP